MKFCFSFLFALFLIISCCEVPKSNESQTLKVTDKQEEVIEENATINGVNWFS